MKTKKIGFIGGGAICEALLGGLINKEIVDPGLVSVHDVVPERLQYLKQRFDIHAHGSGKQVVKTSDILFLTVKPQVMGKVLPEIGAQVSRQTLVVSVAAGITLASIEQHMPEVPVIRVMPNTPVAVGAGMTAVARGTYATEESAQLVAALFSSVGRSVIVDESMMDAVTGLSGSGPAFMFLMLDALSDAGVRVGFPRQTAKLLAAQTMMGAAKMMLDTGEHPAQLRDMVTSPSGTSIAGVHVLEEKAVRAALIDAVVAATNRSREMGRQ
jgi:pyrroline-5-carboxylate reductase